MIQTSNNNEFNIIVHNNGEESVFKVRSFDSILTIINRLRNTASASISKLIYNNLILCYAFSFAFYGIKEGSHIYAITKPQTEMKESDNFKARKTNMLYFSKLNKEKFRQAFEKKYGKCYDEEEFEKHCYYLKDPSFIAEVSRLKDQFYQKIEGTIKCHRKCLSIFFQNKEKLIDYNESSNHSYENRINKENNNNCLKSS